MADDKLTGPERVAAFLLSQPTEVSNRLIGTLDADVIAEVADAMTRIDTSKADLEMVNSTYLELARSLHGHRIQACDDTKLSGILEASVGSDRAEEVLGDLRTRRVHEKPFLELESQPPERLHWVLRDESPTVCALVLAHVDPALSAGVMVLFESERAVEIVKRMATLKPPSLKILRSICEGLSERLESAADSAVGGAIDHLKTIAEMLNFSTGDIERVVLEGLEAENAEAASEVREHMFTWEDIGEIDRRSMQKILGTVDTKTLSLALKASSPTVESNIMDNLSQRVREMVADERELAGAVPLSEVQQSRAEIMVAVRGLMEAGEFSPSKSGEELVS